MSNKPTFQVYLAKDMPSGLEAQSLLEMIDNAETYHIAHNLRPSLGIYNVSTYRVLTRIKDLCEKLEEYIHLSLGSQDKERLPKAQQRLVDYIELAFYSAAEHVDDLDLIAKYFYDSVHC